MGYDSQLAAGGNCQRGN